MDSKRELISKYGPWSVLAIVFLVSLLLWSSHRQPASAVSAAKAVGAAEAKAAPKPTVHGSTKPTVTVKADTEVAGIGQSGIDVELVKRVAGFDAAYYSTRYDETAATRSAKLQRFVGSSFVDEMSGATSLGPNQAQLAMQRNKTIVIAKVASAKDLLLGQSSVDTAVATTTVTLSTTGVNSPTVTTRIGSTSRWKLQSGIWRVLSTDTSGGGGS